ncbi:pyocin protein [Pseudomonas sp. R2-37-08W]|uniref:S-type pyocin domain-containing protein n=1 Tax=Pseudomonas sp. R2-37-08W TaxID=1173273 RepID=UPI000F6C9718|nr:S-type pyocin domain-containing protein [Pseudomonas sp. R2-37-08W]AZF09856.1 pyocin protein [Pseudomonas sp. R2-37-08W]
MPNGDTIYLPEIEVNVINRYEPQTFGGGGGDSSDFSFSPAGQLNIATIINTYPPIIAQNVNDQEASVAAKLLSMPTSIAESINAIEKNEDDSESEVAQIEKHIRSVDTLIAQKTQGYAAQKAEADKYYYGDFFRFPTMQFIKSAISGGRTNYPPEQNYREWYASLEAAYAAKYSNREIDYLNALKQNLQAQANQARADAEAKRIADEAAAAQAARVAAEAEAKRVADEAAAAEAARFAAEAEAKRIADEVAAAEIARLAAEAEAKRIADEAASAEAARVAAEAEAKRIAAEAAATEAARVAAEAQRVAQQQAARQAVFRTAGTLVMPANATAITVSGQGLIQVGEGAAALAKAVADGIAELGRILLVGPGMYIATFVTLGLYSSPTANDAQDRTPDRIRYGLGLPAEQLGLPPGTDLQSIALAQGTIELPWRLTNEAKGDRSLISVVSADGVNVPQAVPVRAATLNATTGLYEVVLPSTISAQPPITLTWTPAAAPGSENPSSTTPAVPPEIPVYTGTTLETITVTAETYPGVITTSEDLIIWFPADSGIAPVYVMFSEPLDSGIFTRKQLDRKFKHAKSFGITDTRKNTETLTKLRDAIDEHLADADTHPQGTYQREEGSKVFFNPKTNNAVILDKEGKFVSGWKLDPNTPQFKNYVEKGVLQ